MIRNTRLTSALALTLGTGLVLALAGCTLEPAPTEDGGDTTDVSGETYYWISQMSTLPLFVANDYPGWESAAEELGVEGVMTGPTNIDLPAFIAAIDQICAQNPAGVAVVGWDPSLVASVDKCVAAGVPTVTVDADLPDSDRFAFIGTDWYEIGVAQAEALMEATEPGKIATLSLIASDNMLQARAGFEATLEGSGFEIVANEDDTGGAEVAASKTASLLAAYPDLVGIAGFDSESGAGIVRALTEAGKAGQIAVTAMEQTPEFFQTVKDGTVSAIIIQKRALFTYYGLKMLYDYNHNGQTILGLDSSTVSPIPATLDTGLLVATADNIDEIIAAQQ